jgi:hypothetical protein
VRIKSHAPWMWLGMSVASLPTLALPSIYLYLMRQDGRDLWFVYLFMTPFLLVGLLLGYFGLRALLRIFVRGSWQLEVPDEGGVLGRPLSATLFPTRDRTPTAELTCRVRCIRMYRNTQASARGNIVTLWEKTWTTSTAMIQPQAGFALVLPLPDHGEPTQMDRTGSGVQWQLNVVVPLQDGSEEPVFDVPVRR